MSRNPHIDLYNAARETNDWRAVSDATLARNLFSMGARQASEQHAKLARRRLRELAKPGDLAKMAARLSEDRRIVDGSLQLKRRHMGWKPANCECTPRSTCRKCFDRVAPTR